MASPQNVFLVGPGYIGRAILDQLLAAGYLVTTLVRKPEQAILFENAGVQTVLGNLTNLELLTAQAAQHEITINTASCDDLPSVEAILSGVRQRVNAGQPSIYIHTSGTGVLEDGATGMYKNPKIYYDDVPEDIDGLASTSMHRHVDIPIIKAAREFGDKAKVVIILPPIVYGWIADHNRNSVALRALVGFALKRGFSGYVGKGANVWSVVHVVDLARAYMVMLTYVHANSPATIVENPYFFAENGSEVSMKECAEHVGQILYDMGKIQIHEAKTFAESDYSDVFGPFTPVGFGCNSRSRAIRLKKLGWVAKEKDVWTSWKNDEVLSIIEELETVLVQQ
jgi:nucleoside-diphosphate-sugar epimerase